MAIHINELPVATKAPDTRRGKAEALVSGRLQAEVSAALAQIIAHYDLAAELKSSISGASLGALLAVLTGPLDELKRLYRDAQSPRKDGLHVEVRLIAYAGK